MRETWEDEAEPNFLIPIRRIPNNIDALPAVNNIHVIEDFIQINII